MKLGRLEINTITYGYYKEREHFRRLYGTKREWFVERTGCYDFYFYRLKITWWKNGY